MTGDDSDDDDPKIIEILKDLTQDSGDSEAEDQHQK